MADGTKAPPEIASIDQSPVMARVEEKRAPARVEEDKKFAERTKKKTELYATANQMLEEGAARMRGGLEQQRAQLVDIQDQLAKNPNDASLQEKFNKLNSEYQSQYQLVESVALASSLKNESRQGTRNKAVALVAVRADLINQLNEAQKYQKPIASYNMVDGYKVDQLDETGVEVPMDKYEDRLNSLVTEIARVNGAVSQLDEMVRVDVRIRGRLGGFVGSRIAGLLRTAAGRERFGIPQQQEYSLQVAQALEAAHQDEAIRNKIAAAAGTEGTSSAALQSELNTENAAIKMFESFAKGNETVLKDPNHLQRVARRNQLQAAIEVRETNPKPDRLRTFVNSTLSQERNQIYSTVEAQKAANEAAERAAAEARTTTTASQASAETQGAASVAKPAETSTSPTAQTEKSADQKAADLVNSLPELSEDEKRKALSNPAISELIKVGAQITVETVRAINRSLPDTTNS